MALGNEVFDIKSQTLDQLETNAVNFKFKFKIWNFYDFVEKGYWKSKFRVEATQQHFEIKKYLK